MKMCAKVFLVALLLTVGCYQSSSMRTKTANSSKLNFDRVFPSVQPTAKKLPGCNSIDQYEETQSKTAWNKFTEHLNSYIDFHQRQLQLLKSGDSSVRTLIWSCFNPVECCGIGDQLYIIQQALVYAIISDRVLSLHWNPSSYETMKYLKPNKIDWSYFNRSQGMKESRSRDQYGTGTVRTAQYYEPFYKQLLSKDHLHLTVNHELQVPFIRGIRMATMSATMNEALARFGITMLLIEDSTKMPLEIFSGELLRFLFLFDSSVVEKVDHIQQQLGLVHKPYLGVHIRTGFLGMEQEEGRHFNSRKAYRNPADWERTITCSISLSERLFGPGHPIYLATDSNLVKRLALSKEYSNSIKLANLTLQHAALTPPKLPWMSTRKSKHRAGTSFPEGLESDNNMEVVNVSVVDGYVATWVDFLLMARATALVHSISGFSVTAGQFCSTRSQYTVPYCTPR